MNDAKIAALIAELKFIHLTNVLYWRKGVQVDRTARAEYFRRQARVLEIRAQFAILKFGLSPGLSTR
jgi:hypothetical protein